MKVKYDPQADAMYLEFKNTTVNSKRISDDIAIDYDSNDNIAGIELIGVKDNFLEEGRLSFELDNILTTAPLKSKVIV